MPFDFDQVVSRRGTGSVKWEHYPEDVLPMWVADMDFASPAPVLRALRERADHGFFGYTTPAPQLKAVVCDRMARLYRWQVTPEQIIFLPSLVSGINVICRAVGAPGDSVLTLTPTYPPFLSSPGLQQRVCDTVELAHVAHGQTISYGLDWDALAGAFHERTRLFLLSHPHNPVGLTYDPATLRRMAELCLRHNTLICSDEIHCDLLLGATRHTPMAALAPEIAERTITLMSPSKTFNLPGLGCGLAIVSNPELRKAIEHAKLGIVPHVNAMGLVAAQAAFAEGETWLTALRAYLTGNRDFLVRYVAEHMPGLRTTVPDATYLAWLDCREAGLTGNPYTFFRDQAKVALSDGAAFGTGGDGFVRLNFGCPHALLVEGLERMSAALAQATG